MCYTEDMWNVILLQEVEDWYLELTEADSDAGDAIEAAIDLLEAEGPALGRPIADRIKGSRFHHMKELRPGSTTIRILFIFDPARQAVLLVAGDKQGNWKGWYDQNIPVAEKRYVTYLQEQGFEE